MEAESARRPPVLVVALLSFAALAAGLATASLFGPKSPTPIRLPD